MEQEADIHTNVAMIFSATQTCLAMEAGPSYASVVISRPDKIAGGGNSLFWDAVAIQKNNGFDTKVLVASLKTQNHMLHCLGAGVDVVTSPAFSFDRIRNHPLTEMGLLLLPRIGKMFPGSPGRMMG